MDYLNNNAKVKKLVLNHQFEKAIAFLHHQIAKNKNIIASYYSLYQIYLKENEISKAIIALESTKPYLKLADKETLIDIYKNLGALYYHQSNHKKAFTFYQKVLKIKNKDPESLAQMCLIYLDFNDLNSAAKILKFLLDTAPNDDYYRTLYAYFQIKSKHFDKAEKVLKDILLKNHEYIPAIFYSGFLYFFIGKYDKAIELLEKCLPDKTYRFNAYYFMGKCKFIQKAYRSAIEHLEKARKLIIIESKLTLDLRYTLVLCYEDTKEFENAMIELRAIHKENPEYKDIQQKLISENYQNIANCYLLDFNGYSEKAFLQFSHAFMTKMNLKHIQHKFENENLLIIEARVDKVNKISKVLDKFINYSKKERLAIIFSRSMPVNEKTFAKIIRCIHFKYNSGLLLTSGEISPLAITFGKNKHFQVIIPKFLDDIIKNMSSTE